MTLFSQRKCLKQVKSVMQVDSIDSELKNCLWNALTIFYWKNLTTKSLSNHKDMDLLVTLLWDEYFKKPIDTINDYWPTTYQGIREYFFNCKWFEVYDFIEFVANKFPSDIVNKNFTDYCNSILEEGLSAYRFVGGKIIQITTEEEISAIEKALDATKPLTPVFHHLKRALDLLADRKSPDYRNSIKEAISAVEALANLITKNKKATLGQALKEIEKKILLHPALKNAFDSLYGYTSNAEGIRHALLEEPNLDFEDAKFMLVSCSAFINYLITKTSKAGIKL